jgi:hypothetical protein
MRRTPVTRSPAAISRAVYEAQPAEKKCSRSAALPRRGEEAARREFQPTGGNTQAEENQGAMREVP